MLARGAREKWFIFPILHGTAHIVEMDVTYEVSKSGEILSRSMKRPTSMTQQVGPPGFKEPVSDQRLDHHDRTGGILNSKMTVRR
jgi:hypothetical protein